MTVFRRAPNVAHRVRRAHGCATVPAPHQHRGRAVLQPRFLTGKSKVEELALNHRRCLRAKVETIGSRPSPLDFLVAKDIPTPASSPNMPAPRVGPIRAFGGSRPGAR